MTAEKRKRKMTQMTHRRTLRIGGPILVLACLGATFAASDEPEKTMRSTTTDATVFAVAPIMGPGDLPDPKEMPDKSARKEKIEISVCPGEVEFGALCVYAGKEAVSDVMIRVGDLVGIDGGADNEGKVVMAALPIAWKFKPDPGDAGLAAKWFDTSVDVAKWAKIRTDVGKGWDAQGFAEERVGYGWYRQTLAANKDAAERKHRVLYFQAVDEEAWVYLDGKLVFEHTVESTGQTPADLWNEPFAADLTNHWSGETDAQILVRVHNSEAMGGIWMPVYLFAADERPTNARMKLEASGDLSKPSYTPEKRISGACFDPYVVQWWWRINPDDQEGPPLRRGELLVKDPGLVVPDDVEKRNRLKYPTKEMRDANTLQPKTLAAGEGVQYLLIARIPRATPPGRYEGCVEITSQDAVIAVLPVAMTVLPFELAQPLLDYLVYYVGGKLFAQEPRTYEPITCEHKTPEQLEADVADILDHGIREPLWLTSPENILAMRRKFAIRGPVLTTYPGTPGADRPDLHDWAKELIAKLREGGCDVIYTAAPDEPKPEMMAAIRENIDFARQLLGVKFFTAVCREQSWENLRQHIDLANIHVNRFGRRKGVAQWQSDGKLAYIYGVASFHADAERFRRYYGLGAWKIGCQGAAPWGYQTASGDPWDALIWNSNFTWPTADGRISTVQWEGMRAAVTDVRYLSTLAERLFRTAGPLADHPARAAAQRAMAAINPDADLDAQRAKIVRHILSLRQAMMEIPE